MVETHTQHPGPSSASERGTSGRTTTQTQSAGSSSSPSTRHHRLAKSMDNNAVSNIFRPKPTAQPEPTTPEQESSRASRLLLHMRRTLSGGKKAGGEVSTTGMYSTPEESFITPLPPRVRSARARHRHDDSFRFHPPGSTPPPSVMQIAMGLHMSRTPYLGRDSDGRGTYSEPEGSVRRSPQQRDPSPTKSKSSKQPMDASRTSLKSALKNSSTGSVSPPYVSGSATTHTSTLSTITVTSPPSTPRSALSALAPLSNQTHGSKSSLLTHTHGKNAFQKLLLFKNHKSANDVPTVTSMSEESVGGSVNGQAKKKVVRFMPDDAREE